MAYKLDLISLSAKDKKVLNTALTLLGTSAALELRDRVNDVEIQ